MNSTHTTRTLTLRTLKESLSNFLDVMIRCNDKGTSDFLVVVVDASSLGIDVTH